MKGTPRVFRYCFHLFSEENNIPLEVSYLIYIKDIITHAINGSFSHNSPDLTILLYNIQDHIFISLEK